MKRVLFNQGEFIYRKGDKAKYAYSLLSGDVELVLDESGTKAVEAGAIFGEVGGSENTVRGESAVAASNVEVIALTTEEINAFLESKTEAKKMSEGLSKASNSNVRGSEMGINGGHEENAQITISYRPNSLNTVVLEDGRETKVTVDSSFVESFNRITELLTRRGDEVEAAVQKLGALVNSIPESLKLELNPEAKKADEHHVATPAEMAAMKINYGPIQDLIDDDGINDILINGHERIFIEKAGKLVLTERRFDSDDHVKKLAEEIVASCGRQLNLRKPVVDARLPDGSRVNVIAQPLAVDGTTISIRKFAKKPHTLESMTENGCLSTQVAEFLKVCAVSRLNMIISGGTGAGKTTLLNAISQHIGHDERIVTIEDAAELRLQQPHVVRLETKPLMLGMRVDEEVTIRDLVKNALRMRPDRIIVGEVRGAEAFDMMQAMNTGHEGSMCTIHSNHPRDGMSRLENMITMANLQIPVKSIRYQVASAVNLVLQISRMRDGRRRLSHITEVTGMEGDVVVMQDIFNFKPEKEDEQGNIMGSFKWSGIMPRFVKRAAYYGKIAELENALGVRIPI